MAKVDKTPPRPKEPVKPVRKVPEVPRPKQTTARPTGKKRSLELAGNDDTRSD